MIKQYPSLFMILLCLLSTSVFGQDNSISGTVVDGDGLPIPGVTIIVKGTVSGTTTDLDGKYTISAPPTSTLVYSFIGYEPVEQQVNNQSVINVTLNESTQALDEVVVVGYGTQEKVNLTGAVGVATSERLQNRPVANAAEGLQGVIPNLNITPRNGDPSKSPEFNIRGYESINGGAPLILVDNVPMNLNQINPNDIESVSVLKDAAAAAVYGSRAAFGVVLVTTKKGKKGKVSVSLNSQFSLAKPILNIDPIKDPHEFVNVWNIANIRTNGVPRFDDDMVEGTKKWSENPTLENAWGVRNKQLRFYGYNNYQDELLTDFAPTQQYDLSISGGSENSNYFVSFGHLNKDGYLNSDRNENFKRYNALMKGEFKVSKWLTLEEKIVVNSQRSDKPYFYNWDVNINSFARVSPIQPIQFPDLPFYIEEGDRPTYERFIGKYFDGTNFWPYLNDGGRSTWSTNDIWLTQGIVLTPVKGLKIQSNFSYNFFYRTEQDVASKVEVLSTGLGDPDGIISNGFSGNDFIEEKNRFNQYYVFNAFADYKFNLPEKHVLTTMVGFNQEWGQNKLVSAKNNTLVTPLIQDLKGTIGNQTASGGSDHNALRGVFYRVNYIFDERYLIETNGRYDGTSRFPKADRFGFFPSISLGWRISNEEFMTSTSGWLDELKLRASYGELGNQTLLDRDGNPIWYPYVATLGIGQSPYMMTANNRTPYVSPAGLVSPTLTWETVASKNIGLDFTLLQGKLNTSFDLYSRETKDMLMKVTYPSILGTDAPQANAADLRTTGWELAVTWRDGLKNGLSYDVTLALANSSAEITKFENPTGAISTNSSGELSSHYVGQKLGEIWGFETVGIFQTEDEVASAPDQTALGSNWRPGDIRYADLDGDGKITMGNNTLSDPGDRKIIGNTTPRLSFGINNNLQWKNFTLNMFFQGIWKRDHWPSSGNWTWFFPFNSGYAENYFITESWSEDNRDAYFPAPHISTNDKKNIQTQTRFLQNAGYIRLKNLAFGYNLPDKWMNKIGLQAANIYLSGANLWEYSPIRKPLDPESIYSGAIEYPLQRIYTFGFNVTF